MFVYLDVVVDIELVFYLMLWMWGNFVDLFVVGYVVSVVFEEGVVVVYVVVMFLLGEVELFNIMVVFEVWRYGVGCELLVYVLDVVCM